MLGKLKHKIYKALKWSEKYTKTDMVYLARGGSWLVGGQVVNTIVGLALAIGIANLLPKEVYGNYKFILSLAAIIGAFTLTGMATAITQAVARGFEGALSAGFKVQLKWSILMILASLALAIYYFLNDNSSIAISLLIIGFFSPILAATSLYGSFILGKKDFKTHVVYGIYRNSIPIALILLTIFFTKNPILIVLVYFLSRAIINGLLYFRTIKKYRVSKEIDTTTIPYSKHLSVMNVINVVAIQLDKILVFHYLGAAQLAIYAFALIVPQQVSTLFRNIALLAMPKLSNIKPEMMRGGVYQKSRLLAGMLATVAVIYVLIAPFIYHLFFPQYEESILISQFAILSLLTLTALLPSIALQAGQAVREQHKIVLYGSVLHIVILFPLVITYGIWGALGALVLAKAIKVLLTYHAFHKFTEPRST